MPPALCTCLSTGVLRLLLGRRRSLLLLHQATTELLTVCPNSLRLVYCFTQL